MAPRAPHLHTEDLQRALLLGSGNACYVTAAAGQTVVPYGVQVEGSSWIFLCSTG